MIIKSWSWTVYNDDVAIKLTDKSVFDSHVSGIPEEIRFFFSIENMQKGQSIPITILYNDAKFQAKIEKINTPSEQTRIVWYSELSNLFNQKFPDVLQTHNYPELRFNKIDDKTYNLEFIYTDLDDETIESDQDPLESKVPVESVEEGHKILYYTTRYERSEKNRKEAIRIHGTCCMACGFDFEKTYGKRGRNYIEVHHIKPLYSQNEKVEVNPETDLICLCSNCHRMIHRKKNTILTLYELKDLIESNREG